MSGSRAKEMMEAMAATASRVDALMAKAMGKPEPKPKPEPAKAGPGSGSRSYRVSDWRSTCSGCPRDGKCGMDKRECGSARWFPIVHYVSLRHRGGAVVSAGCCDGRKAGGPRCADDDPDKRCRHIERAIAAMEGRVGKDGKPDRGVELVMVSGDAEVVPRCPSCRDRWGVTASRTGKAWECRSPVCVRDGKPWTFDDGDVGKPAPMRHGLVILGRDPGRMLMKR